MHLLVVEDDVRLSDVVRRGLLEEGYTVDLAERGDDALLRARLSEYDAIVLDVMLPGKSGVEVCRELRASGLTTPILMLTARDTVDETVSGLEAGADDYMAKPFAFQELRARLHSIMRRAGGAASSQLQVGDLVLDLTTRQVLKGEELVSLTNREYQVLEYFMHNRGRVLSRTMIEEHVWGYDYNGFSNTVDVHVKRLRQKIDRPGMSSRIETVRGAGYRLVNTG